MLLVIIEFIMEFILMIWLGEFWIRDGKRSIERRVGVK